MAIDFPNSPTIGSTFSVGGRSWTWNGTTWTQSAAQGPQGPQGPQGAGVPTGGTAGQVLAKNSSTNYDTSWTSTPSTLPRGRVTSASTATQTNVSSLTGLTGLTCPAYTFSTSRWYRITVTLEAFQFLAGAENTLLPYIYDSTAGVKLFDLPRQQVRTTDVQPYSASVITNTLTGSDTIQAAANVTGGTIGVGNGTVRMSIIVEDIGPV